MYPTKTYLISDKLKGKKGSSTHIVEQKGSEISICYFQQYGFVVPILVREVDGLNFKVPDSSISISDLKKLLGTKRMVKISVNNSANEKEWNLGEWLKYFEDRNNREEVLYLKDFEFSLTKLQIYVDQPLIAKQLDWVENVWTKVRRDESEIDENQSGRSRLSRLCSMVVTATFQDFEIDPGGSSRWYHVFSGRQTMWLINGSTENWELYKDWLDKGKVDFLGDIVKHCLKIQLIPKNTIFVPAGWIYAIYTSLDSIVFSGLFIHSFSISTQLQVYDFQSSKIDNMVKHLHFYPLLMHVIQRYIACISCTPTSDPNAINNAQNKDHINLSKYELEGLEFLVDYLEKNQDKIKNQLSDILKSNYAQILYDFKELVKAHANDDHNLSYTGKSSIFSSNKRCSDEGDIQMCGRRRRVRCKRCDACTRTECGTCSFCRDMKKFGGQGKMKQTCISRQCIAPMLPIAAICGVCSQGDFKAPDGFKKTEFTDNIGEKIDETLLMECSVCFEIAHPHCLKGSSDPVLSSSTPVTLNKDMPNSWICPKCYHFPPTHSKKSHLSKSLKKADVSSGESDLENDKNISNKKDGSMEDDLSDEGSPELYFQDMLTYKSFPIPYAAQSQYAPKFVVRMCPLSPPPQYAPTINSTDPQLPFNIWLKIFEYLSPVELCTCSGVCKAWNRWSFNHKLWTTLDLSNRLIKQVHLKALVLRQPRHLNLAYTNISGLQLTWLLPRLPHLLTLDLTLSCWPSICPALCNAQWHPTRYLTTLCLTGVQHLNDAELLRMLSAPSCNQETGQIVQWRLTELVASGTQLSSDCVRCISEYLPCVTRLHVGYCVHMDDQLLVELVKWNVARGLVLLNVEQCSHISDHAVDSFKNENQNVRIVTTTDKYFVKLTDD